MNQSAPALPLYDKTAIRFPNASRALSGRQAAREKAAAQQEPLIAGGSRGAPLTG